MVPHEQLVQKYRQADLVVNPSLSESFGMSLIEAMACETPVVATAVGGMKETVVHGQTGLLVPPNDAVALADAMAAVLDDPHRAREMGVAGRARAVERFSWDRIVGDLLGHYDRLHRQ
jgi:glycosyltransferase involved in cell wall biosynthesis